MRNTPTKRTRRHHAPELKRQVVLACQQPGASVAGVALAHGLNANLVRRWLQHGHKAPGALSVVGASPGAFVELPMPCVSGSTAEPIRLDLAARTHAAAADAQLPGLALTATL